MRRNELSLLERIDSDLLKLRRHAMEIRLIFCRYEYER